MENNISSLWILEGKEPERGSLGLLVGERGAGKSACLTNIGVEKLLNGHSVLHVSLEDMPDQVSNYYELKIQEIMKATGETVNKGKIESNRTIFSYLNQTLSAEKLRSSEENLKESGYTFDLMLLDGLQTEDVDLFQSIKDIATEYGMEVWLTYPMSRYLSLKDKLKDICDSILVLYGQKDEVYVVLEKGENEGRRLELDPITFFARSL